MKAMILSAGFGKRLMPLTDTTPKALIKLGGIPLLRIILTRLQRAGFDEVAVNVHHHADQVQSYLQSNTLPGLKTVISYEKHLLGTGGGIKKMVQMLGTNEPILVHNVDVLTDLDLAVLYQHHLDSGTKVNLAVQSRDTTRYLIFDENSCLCGRMLPESQTPYFSRKPEGGIYFRAFNGIQVVDPEIFLDYPHEKFSSIELYLRLAENQKISGYEMKDQYWRDLGRLENLEQGELDIKAGLLSIT